MLFGTRFVSETDLCHIETLYLRLVKALLYQYNCLLYILLLNEEVKLMDNFKEICLNEMEELEELVCLGSGGTVACCNGRDGNASYSQ